MADIFVSYARADETRVRPLVRALEGEGWSVFRDTAISAAPRYLDVLLKELTDARCVVVAWTKVAAASNQVEQEADAARQAGTVLPVLLEPVALPSILRDINAADLTSWDGDPADPRLGRLIADLRGILGRSPADKPGAPHRDGPAHPPDARAPSAGAERGPPGAEATETTRAEPSGHRWRRGLARVVRLALVLVAAAAASYGAALVTGAGLARLTLDGAAAPTGPCADVPGEGPEMVVVLGGSFEMGDSRGTGDNDEKPVHAVRVATFAIGRCEVTFDEYDAFASATGRPLPDDYGWGRGRRPVIDVSWEDATAYAQWLSEQTGKRYRLPSEAEWEYAARAGTATEYWWGDDIRRDGKVWANCNGCGSQWDNKQTAPVGSFAASPFGLYDTAGNVLEWVQDCRHDSYAGAPGDGSAWLEVNGGDCAQRVLRGGSWYFHPWHLRSANRNRGPAGGRDGVLGFRLAQDL